MAVVHGYAIAFFTGQKVLRKAAAATATAQLGAALNTPAHNMVPDFRAYEAAHLNIGNMPFAGLATFIQDYVAAEYNVAYPIAAWGSGFNRAGPKRVEISLAPPVQGVAAVSATVREPQGTLNPLVLIIGRVYYGDARFEQLAPALQPANALNTVFIRRGFPNQHYIRYTRGTPRYVRRYVIRGLNQEDSVCILNGRPLVAPEQGGAATDNEIPDADHSGKHNVASGTALTDAQQLLSHTRGWKKRFISTTTTFQPAYSTRGEEFRSVFGKVIVDLAFIPGVDIFDLHTPDSISVFNTNALAIQSAAHNPNPKTRTLHDEEVLAARDVIRTRELLIRGSVPVNALRFRQVGQSVIAIRHQNGPDTPLATFAAVETAWGNPHPWVALDAPSYTWNGSWYRFYGFVNQAATNGPWAQIPPAYHNRRQRMTEYDFPALLPLGFQR
jgi:hypothetical protein